MYGYPNLFILQEWREAGGEDSYAEATCPSVQSNGRRQAASAEHGRELIPRLESAVELEILVIGNHFGQDVENRLLKLVSNMLLAFAWLRESRKQTLGTVLS